MIFNILVDFAEKNSSASSGFKSGFIGGLLIGPWQSYVLSLCHLVISCIVLI